LFIQSLEQKRQFEADCAVIIPALDQLWIDKILYPFGINCVADPTAVINWRHCLYSYTPQLLTKAITRLASRLRFVVDPVMNVSAYYKNIVRDLRRKEHLRWKKKKDQDAATNAYVPGENPDHPNDENLEM